MTIQQIVQHRNITRLLHFTHADNLSSIITNGLVSRQYLDAQDMNYELNDELRLEGHLDATCLSISFPNSLMFYKYRNLKPGDWVILAIDPSVLWIKNCAFYPTNAASSTVRSNEIADMQGPSALNAMFAETVGSITRDQSLNDKYTTDVQAEVLVFDKIEPSYILKVIHPNRTSFERFDDLHPEVEHRYYASTSGRTLYSQRSYVLG
ncbi:DarT ssDNA thymidine ADP-ribosyltransferase family protein [Citrobacter freundii]